MTITRAQAKRALEWEDFLALPRSRRPKVPPGCVTCGAARTFEWKSGEPGYGCRHEAVRIDDETMERARETWRPERKRD